MTNAESSRRWQKRWGLSDRAAGKECTSDNCVQTLRDSSSHQEWLALIRPLSDRVDDYGTDGTNM